MNQQTRIGRWLHQGRKMLSILLTVCMLFSLCACSKSAEESLQKDIDKLKNKNEKLSGQIDDLKEENDDLSKQNESLSHEADDLKKANESLSEEVDQLKEEIAKQSASDPGQRPSNPQDAGLGKVGISLPTNYLQRWVDDGDNMKKALIEAGYDVMLEYADNSVQTQVEQVENMIQSGCTVLVITPIDEYSFGSVLDNTEHEGVTVISFDRLIQNSESVDYHVSFDNYLVGTLQAEYIVSALDLDNGGPTRSIELTAGEPYDVNAKFFYLGAYDVLKPYIDSGRVEVVSGQIDFESVATTAWMTDEAQKRAEAILATYYSDGKNVDAWLCSNDSTALGVEMALETSYTGSYPVITGQDCDIANVKNILSGKQAMSVFKESRILCDQTVKMVTQIMTGATVDVNDTTTSDNGAKIVPAYLCAPVFVDINNYEEILIESGYYPENLFEEDE
ncbi:MAG: substrate-binding domain-containing protein [Clostridiales bacterium]|nr:substrate-binding domain-containing protein [Clostridiales bacterium]